MNKQRGVTLIEVMMAAGVAAILFGLAVPAVSGSLEATRAGQAQAGLFASILEAVGNATTTGVHSVLCPSANGTSCLESADWSAGWVVFQDSNGSRELEGGERILRVQRGLCGKVHLRSTVGRTRLVFQANGGNQGSNVTFTLCDGRGPSRARALIISNTGGLREAAASAAGIAATCSN